MSKERDSKKRIAFPTLLFAEGSSSVEVPSEIHVVPMGEWDHAMYGHMKIDAGDIQQFIQNFNAGIRKDLRVTAGHDNGMSGGELPALGWFKELFAKEDGGAKKFVMSFCNANPGATAVVAVGTDAAAGATRQIGFGDQIRYRAVMVDGDANGSFIGNAVDSDNHVIPSD